MRVCQNKINLIVREERDLFRVQKFQEKNTFVLLENNS